MVKDPFKTMFRGTSNKKHQFNRPEGAGNFDNMDDYNIVEAVEIKEGTIQDTPTADKHIVNKKFVDDKLIETFPTNFTDGSVIFAENNKLAQNNSDFFWDSVNKRLGIGINTPLASLHVKNSGTPLLLQGTGLGTVELNVSTTGDLTIKADDDIRLNNGGADLTLQQNGIEYARLNKIGTNSLNLWTREYMILGTDGNNERVRIDEGGNVGIGTTTPNEKLHVVGNSLVSANSTVE